MKKKNILKAIMLVLVFFSLLYLVMSCNNVDINNILNINTNQEKAKSEEPDDGNINFLDEKDNNKKNKGSNTDVTSILLINQEANVDTLLEALDATLENTFEFGNKKYIVVKGMNRTIEEVQKLSEVYYAEPNYERQLLTTPNDTYYSFQYAPQITGLEAVWESGYTGRGVVVAVVDSGVNTLHEDFGGPSAFIAGYDNSTDGSYTTTTHHDELAHGTHVAGIIAARRNNGKGIAGVAPEATIMPIRIPDASGKITVAYIAKGILFAAENGADVINLSLGVPEASALEMDVVKYAIEQNITVVVSSGNDGIFMKNYPAAIAGVIAVASTNGRDEVSSYSTRDANISVAAPGEDILSLKSGDIGLASSEYITYDGTSMAAPFVAGVAALIKQKFPDATPAQIKEILERTALDIDVPGFDYASGHGRVQPVLALAENLPDVSWIELELELRAGTSIESSSALTTANHITLIDSSNAIIGSLLTNSEGKASVYLPAGTYTYTTSYYGIAYTGDVTLVDTRVSLSKVFIESEITNYYRISTFYNSDDVDTILSIYRYDTSRVAPDATNPEYDLNNYGYENGSYVDNDDKSDTDIYSEIIFKAESGDRFMFQIESSSDSNPTGFYELVLDRAIFSDSKSSTDYVDGLTDVTNNEQFPEERTELELDQVYKGELFANDHDFFFYTVP